MKDSYLCRICGHDQADVHCHVVDNTSRQTGLEFDYVKCRRCGTLSLSPMPTPEQSRMANETLLGITREGSSFDKRYTPEYRESLRREYRLTLSDLGFPLQPPREGAKVFDFGCATGPTLDLLADEGWQTYGCDISTQLTSLADHDRHRICTGEIDDVPAEWGPFDLVITIEVLEHLQQPRQVLAKLADLVVPGGTLITETPQVGLLAELYGPRWRVLAGLDHTHLMPRETQISLLEDLGFQVESTVSFGSGCTMGLVPGHIKQAFDQVVKRYGIGDFLAIRARKVGTASP